MAHAFNNGRQAPMQINGHEPKPRRHCISQPTVGFCFHRSFILVMASARSHSLSSPSLSLSLSLPPTGRNNPKENAVSIGSVVASTESINTDSTNQFPKKDNASIFDPLLIQPALIPPRKWRGNFFTAHDWKGNDSNNRSSNNSHLKHQICWFFFFCCCCGCRWRGKGRWSLCPAPVSLLLFLLFRFYCWNNECVSCFISWLSSSWCCWTASAREKFPPSQWKRPLITHPHGRPNRRNRTRRNKKQKQKPLIPDTH